MFAGSGQVFRVTLETMCVTDTAHSVTSRRTSRGRHHPYRDCVWILFLNRPQTSKSHLHSCLTAVCVSKKLVWVSASHSGFTNHNHQINLLLVFLEDNLYLKNIKRWIVGFICTHLKLCPATATHVHIAKHYVSWWLLQRQVQYPAHHQGVNTSSGG